MTLPIYPPNLGWMKPETLASLGLRENDRGQVCDHEGRLVCEVSGRSHDGGPDREPYLIGPLPHYLPAEGRWVAIWIDRQTAVEAGIAAARRGGSAIVRWLQSVAARVFRR